MIVRVNHTGVRHRADDIESGALTECGEMLAHSDFTDSKDPADCPGCLSGTRPETVSPPGLRQQRSSKPAFRQPRNLRSETVEAFKMAHKEIVAALEWMERGSSGQFTHNALGRAHLAQRFLTETLVNNGIIERVDNGYDD